jgi:hypothetical protein
MEKLSLLLHNTLATKKEDGICFINRTRRNGLTAATLTCLQVARLKFTLAGRLLLFKLP